jgi:putative membrane protein
MTERVYYVPAGCIVVEESFRVAPCAAQPNYNFPSGGFLLRTLINWLLSALAVWVVAQFVHGFHVQGAKAALIAALVIGLVNATLGAFLKVITLPLTVLTLGIFWLVINALMLELASWILSPSFHVDGFAAAFWGAIVLSLVNMLFRWMAGTNRRDHQR